jgi:hypothetical protein
VPYLDTALRQQLNLATSCPSEEDIAAACANLGLVLRDGQLIDTSTAQPPVAPVKKAPKAKTKAETQTPEEAI